MLFIRRWDRCTQLGVKKRRGRGDNHDAETSEFAKVSGRTLPERLDLFQRYERSLLNAGGTQFPMGAIKVRFKERAERLLSMAVLLNS